MAQGTAILAQLSSVDDWVNLAIGILIVVLSFGGSTAAAVAGRTEGRRVRERTAAADELGQRVHRATNLASRELGEAEDRPKRRVARRPSTSSIRRPSGSQVRVSPRGSGLSAVAAAAIKTSGQQADLYLQHHKMALRHSAAYNQASLFAGIFGFLLILVGAALTFFVGLDVGIVTAVAGLVPTAAAGLLFKRAREVELRTADSFEKLTASVRQSESILQVLQVTSRLTDEQRRNRIFELVALQAFFPDSSAADLVAALGTRDEPEDEDE